MKQIIKNFLAKIKAKLEEHRQDYYEANPPSLEWTNSHDTNARQLVYDKDTDKYVWTDGIEPFPLTEEEKQPYTYISEQPSFVPKPTIEFEPLRNNRFTVEFFDIPNCYIQDFWSSDNNSSIKILLTGGNEEFDTITKLQELSVPAKKKAAKKTKKSNKKVAKKKDVVNAKLNICDITGDTLYSITMNNVKVEQVDMLSDFTYQSDALQFAHVHFSHDKRIIKKA